MCSSQIGEKGDRNREGREIERERQDRDEGRETERESLDGFLSWESV